MKIYTNLCLAMMALSIAGCQTTVGQSGTDTYSGFSFNKSLKFDYKPYGYTVVSKMEGQPVRTGEQSMRFEVRAGDCGSDSGWSDCDHDRERHELSSKQSWGGGEHWYHWSIFLPHDYPIIYPVKTALGQFHQRGSHPVFMFQNGNGGYFIDNQVTGSTQDYELLLNDEQMRGKWNDVLVHVKWTDKANGFFNVFLNGASHPKYAWSGATKRLGKSTYYKFGIYRSYMTRRAGPEPTQVVYYDNVKHGTSCMDVVGQSGFDCAAVAIAKVEVKVENCTVDKCPEEYGRTPQGIAKRLTCWRDAPQMQNADGLPTTAEITAFASGMKGVWDRITERTLVGKGLPPATLKRHGPTIVEMLNFPYGSTRYCNALN